MLLQEVLEFVLEREFLMMRLLSSDVAFHIIQSQWSNREDRIAVLPSKGGVVLQLAQMEDAFFNSRMKSEIRWVGFKLSSR